MQRPKGKLSADGEQGIPLLKAAPLDEDPKATQPRMSRLSRNTNGTLMSRGMKSCWLISCDSALQAFLRQNTHRFANSNYINDTD